jgi:hypothetical protein
MERNSEMYKREALGVITSSSKEAFTTEFVDRMQKKDNDVCIEVIGKQKELYVAIDPAGGAWGAEPPKRDLYSSTCTKRSSSAHRRSERHGDCLGHLSQRRDFGHRFC